MRLIAEALRRQKEGAGRSPLAKAFSEIEKRDLKPKVFVGPKEQVDDLMRFKPQPTFKGYAWRGNWRTETRLFVGYDELLEFIRKETEKHNAIEFAFWIEPQ